MAPFEATQRPQVSRAGPPVWLRAPRALALAMALHELATNVAKYGALSRPEGRVAIRWRLTDVKDELLLSWTEENGPLVICPARPGFGSRLLQRSLPAELAAEVKLTFAREGVCYEIRFMLEPARAAPALEMAEIMESIIAARDP